MITPETVRDHPELRRSFDAYITPDGHRSRIDLTQADRIYSAAAMDQVETLRRRTNEFLGDFEGLHVTARISGENAESADIRALIRSDQVQSWYVVPVGVFLVLILTLRDPLACLNLVATMVLTYAFALGATHLLFVTILGAAGIDWKVPYFLFVLLVAVGVDYNVFLMARLREESHRRELGAAIIRAVGQTGGLITSAAAITACSFASFLFSPLGSLRQLGFALVVGITIDALVVRPAAGPVRSLADETPRRVASAFDPRSSAAPRFADRAGLEPAAIAAVGLRPSNRPTRDDVRAKTAPSDLRRRDGGWPASKPASPSFRSRPCRHGKTRLRANGHIVFHANLLWCSGTVISDRTSCGPAPAITGEAERPSQMLLWPANRSAICMARIRPSTGIVVRVVPVWFAKMTGTSRSRATSVGIVGRHGPHVTEQTVPAAAMTAREFGPGGRDHRQVDPAAVVVPDPAVHHVGTDRQADPAPRRLDHQRRPAGSKRNASQKTRCLFR